MTAALINAMMADRAMPATLRKRARVRGSGQYLTLPVWFEMPFGEGASHAALHVARTESRSTGSIVAGSSTLTSLRSLGGQPLGVGKAECVHAFGIDRVYDAYFARLSVGVGI